MFFVTEIQMMIWGYRANVWAITLIAQPINQAEEKVKADVEKIVAFVKKSPTSHGEKFALVNFHDDRDDNLAKQFAKQLAQEFQFVAVIAPDKKSYEVIAVQSSTATDVPLGTYLASDRFAICR